MYNLVLDIDGVLSCGGGFYTSEGVYLKQFELNALESLDELKAYIKNVYFISAASKPGFAISEAYVMRLGHTLLRVLPENRKSFISSLEGKTIFIGDGIYDAKVADSCYRFIALQDSTPQAKRSAHVILPTISGSNVLAHLLDWLETHK